MAVKCIIRDHSAHIWLFSINWYSKYWNPILKNLLFSGPKLTDEMMLNLSRRITSEEELRALGTKGLRIPEYKIATHLRDYHNKITLAAHHVIKDWRKTVADPFQAYSLLCEALRKAELAAYIYEVLQWHL